jgi:Acyl transferase domain./Beta-ketoacyl synthase, C-terminal domain.
LGDPIEVAALTQAFRAGTDKKGYCGIGSVKSNIGHVDKAAGLAGLIKTTLALDHGMIPPNLHFKQPNPKLNLPDSPFYVVDGLQPWPRNPQAPRRAGISSFGVGGTNAHAIIEEAPLPTPGSPSRPVQLMVVSAKTEAALSAAAENMAAFLEREPHINLADTCHTLHKGRRAFAHRLAFTCTTAAEAVSALRTSPHSHTDNQADRGLVFMFPGQGSQYAGMGAELYQQEAVFREQIDLCAQILAPELGLDIRSLLFPAEADSEAAAAQLKQTALAQPALFTIEYALAQLWLSWGLQPRAMIGHSLGEYVAACLAGVFSLQDALTLVAARSRLMQSMPVGAMLAVPMDEATLLTLLGELAQPLDLAAVNGPELCVVSGPLPAIEALQNQLTGQGLSPRLLHTSHAFHSAMMEPMLAPFTDLLRRIELKPPQIPYISNLTGTWISEAEATNPEYWTQHLRHTVRFGEGSRFCWLPSHRKCCWKSGPDAPWAVWPVLSILLRLYACPACPKPRKNAARKAFCYAVWPIYGWPVSASIGTVSTGMNDACACRCPPILFSVAATGSNRANRPPVKRRKRRRAPDKPIRPTGFTCPRGKPALRQRRNRLHPPRNGWCLPMNSVWLTR